MTMSIDGSVGITFPNGTVQTTAAVAANVTAAAPLASTGGANPVISLPGIVAPAHGGTGAASLSGFLFGNGTLPATVATATDLTSLLGSTPVDVANNLDGGALNRIPFQTAPGVTGFLAAPTVPNTALEWDGTNFVWNTAGSGTVSSVSVVGANGFAGTVATATSTPAITISTSVTGVLKGNGTAISAAAGSDIATALGSTPVALATSVAGGAATQIPYQTAPGVTGFVTAPTVASTALQWNGANYVWAAVGTGSVTNTSVVTANGFVGTVANSTTTPAITISTNVTGIVKGNGAAISAATASDITTLLGTTPVTAATNLDGGLAGSVPYQTAAGTTTLLPIGTVDQVLTVSAGGLPIWAPSAIVFGSTPQELGDTITNLNGIAIGGTTAAAVTGTTITANTQFAGPGTGLTGTAAGLKAGLATAVAGGTGANQLLYQSATDTTSFLANPTVTGTALTYNGTNLVWSNPSAASTNNITGGAAGSLPYQTAANTTGFLAAGTANQQLIISGGVPAWSTQQDLTFSSSFTTSPATTAYNPNTAVTLDLKTQSGVTAGTIGSATVIPVITVNAQGIITATNTAISVALVYKGTWNATTNVPALADGTGTQGNYYVCNVAGTVNLGSGPLNFAIGDWVVYNGAQWDQVFNSQTTSVANFTVTGIPQYQTLVGGGSNPISGVAVGTAGQVLTSNGAGAYPTYQSLGTMASQAASAVAVTGGTINGTSIGATTPSTGAFTTLTASTGFSGAGTGLTGTAAGLSIGGTAATATNIAGGAAGSLVYQSAAGVTTTLAAGTAGQVLTMAAGNPSWATGTITFGTTAQNLGSTVSNIDGVIIGATTAAAITGTTITATKFVGVSGGTF